MEDVKIIDLALGERNLMFNRTENLGMNDALQKMYDMEKASEDYTVLYDDMDFVPILSPAFDEHTKDYYNLMLSVPSCHRPAPFSKWGLSQMSNSLGIPSAYIEKCINMGTRESVEMAIENINFWKNMRRNERSFVRMTDDRVMGMLSSKYSAYDDSEFMEEIFSDLPKTYNFEIKNSIVSPDITKLRIVNDKKILIDGDELSFGFDISNSRVGRAAMSVKFIIYRWACSNGMLFGGGRTDMFSVQHRGLISTDALQHLLVRIPDLLNDIKGWVESAKENKLDDKSLDYLMANFKRNYNSEATANNVIQVMDEKYGRTRYGLANAITEVAQGYNVFTRTQLEAYAGQLLKRKAA